MRTVFMGGRLLVAAGLLALAPGCRRKLPPPPTPVVTAPESPLEPWGWYKLGGLLVVTGEVDKPVDLVLKGRYLDEHMHAEFGPVRWEMYAPPPQEIAELRTGEGVLLATWDFDTPLPEPVQPQSQQAPPPPPPPVKPRPVSKPRSAPWPDTHMPSVHGPSPRPGKVTQAPLPAPKPVPKPVPALPPVKPKPPRVPWPDTHLPLIHGPSPRPVKLPKPLPPAPKPIPKPAPILPSLKPKSLRVPWPDTHLPLVHGPSPRPAKAPRARPIPKPAPVLPSLKPKLPRDPWPDTHLPLVHGPSPKPAKAPKALPPTPKPAPKPVLPAMKPRPPQVPWPDTHLPAIQGPSIRQAPRIVKTEPTPVPPPLSALPPPPERRHATLPSKPPAEPSLPPRPVLPSLPSQEWPGAGEAFNLIRGPRGSHWVCLTFDGGSTAEVAVDVLDALKERGIRTTFFLTGAFIRKYPDLVRRIDREGHEIGNHTMDHPHFAPGGRRDPRWTKERFQRQLLQADELLLKLLGHPMDSYWRAPYGENTAELRTWAEELGYRHVYWSEGADTLDWATVKERKLYHTGDAILDRLHSRMGRNDGDGLIVLMHLGSGRPESDRPARVLGPFLDKALDEGWNFVTISAYLKEAGKPVWNSSRRLAMLGQNASRQ